MKKVVFLVTLFFLFFQIAGLSQKASVGISGGFAIADMKITDIHGTQATDTRTGVMGGLIVETPIGKHFLFQPGLFYVQKGHTNPPVAGSTNKVYTTLRYAEFPLNFLFKAGGKQVTFYIGGGPCIDLNAPSKTVTKDSSGKRTYKDISFGKLPANDVLGVDYGVNALAGIRLPMGFFISV